MKKLICLWIAFCTVITAVLPTAQMTVYAQNSLSETTLRVGTWNIAAKNHPDVKTLSKVISDNDIEIVGVQEVDMFNSRNNYDMMADFISEDLPYIHFAKGRDYAGGDFGIGVVSKYPLLEMNTSPLETYDSLATKVVERTLIEKDGKMIAFYNVHLSVDSSDPRELRQIQIAQIVQRIALDPTEYKIIVGDFNADQDHYEFSRLLDMFNMANGKDGNWIDTYHENDDPNMKEFAIDNILTTKNIQIDDVQIVKNDLSDHYLLYADLTLLDEKAPALRNNLALGATVNTDQEDEVSPYALVDYSYDEGWKSQNPSMITLKLDHTVVQGNLKMYWGEQKASKYKVSISSNGKSWSLCEEVNNVNDVDTVSLGNARYLKIELIEKEKDVFDLREIEVYGTFDESLDEIDIPSSNNILENGGFEEWSEVVKLDNQPSGTWWDTNIWDNNQKAAPWIYQIYQGTEALSKYYMAYKDSEEKVEGNYSVRVEKTAGATKDGFFKLQNYPFTQNQKYRVSFWYKTKDLANNTLILSLFGETKLASSEEWTYFEKEFTATKATETLNMRVNGSNTGVYWLDDYQIVPVVEQDMTTLLEMLQLKTSSYKLALGETTTLVPIYYPTDAEDQEIVWTTSDSNIATVDENGNVKALNRGRVVISAASLSQPLITASVTLTIYSDTIETKKLQDAILVAQTKNEKDYTEESWNRFEEAYNNVCQALVSTESQEAIDSALENLLFAQSLLSFVKSKVSEDFYKDMREYWVNEMIGIHDLCDDKDIISVVDELDLQVKKYLETMNDLSDTSIKTIWSDEELLANTGGAEVTVMLDRLKMMAIQTKNLMSDYYQDEEAIASIMEAVQFIVEKRYNKNSGSTTNWWDGEIGTPKSLVDITLIYYDEFIKKNPQFIQDVCEAVDAHIPYANRRGTTSSGLKETGANLIDKVAIVLKRSLLDKNHERLVHAKECMSPLFTLVTSGDGFYKDGSFIFHTNIAYNGSYGAVLIDELVNCVALLNLSDTPIGKKELQFINEQIENAFIPFITYGGNLIDSVRGRAIARYAQQGDTMGTKMMGILLQYAAITDTTTSEMIKSSLKTILDQKFAHDVTQDYSLLSYSDLLRIKSLEKNQDVIGKVSEDNYHQYSYMNKAVAQRRLFTFALSMSSNRIYNTETGNTENTKGYYQGQGMTQIYTEDVNQYNENYWALVDPYRLPGVTSGHQNLSSGTAGQSNWAGGSTLDGINGVSGQIISANKTLNGSKTSGISANKSWFVLDNRIVAIGSNIINSNEEVQQVETILDNRKVEEAVLTDLEGNILGESGISSSKAFLLQDKNHSMGYIVLDGQSVNYLSETRTGSWYDINQLGKFTDHTVREANFVSLAIDHGQATSSANYQYMIIPGANETILKEIVDNPG
ncbi:MAG: polysaccharide lyase family 8 super-sandwich domain-containing protein, partial [Traorella sp.]